MNGRWIALALLCLVLTACAGTQFTWDDARRIREGMSVAEVTEIMGPPYMMTVSGRRSIYTWSYATAFTGARAMSIVFVDGVTTSAPDLSSLPK